MFDQIRRDAFVVPAWVVGMVVLGCGPAEPGVFSEHARAIAADAAGNVYIARETLGAHTQDGLSDVRVAKHDASGTEQWTRELGTAGYDRVGGAAAEAAGNMYVVGSTAGSLDGNTHAGNEDFFVAKYDSSGTKLWTRQHGTTGFERANDVSTDGAGNVYIAGYTEESLDGNTHAGGKDLFVAKYDSSGTKQWTR